MASAAAGNEAGHCLSRAPYNAMPSCRDSREPTRSVLGIARVVGKDNAAPHPLARQHCSCTALGARGGGPASRTIPYSSARPDTPGRDSSGTLRTTRDPRSVSFPQSLQSLHGSGPWSVVEEHAAPLCGLKYLLNSQGLLLLALGAHCSVAGRRGDSYAAQGHTPPSSARPLLNRGQTAEYKRHSTDYRV